MPTMLSDKAMAVFAFAAYHRLSSGETVVDVVLRDGSGHAADPEAIRELEDGGFAKTQGDRAAFTPAGKERLDKVIDALRASA